MKFKLNRQSILALFLVFFSSIAFAVESAPANTATVDSDKTNNIYSEEKPNIMVDSQHTEFTIKLKSNPTTGYSWFLREYDNKFITPIKHKYQNDPNNKLIGASGFEYWTFRMKPEAFVVPQQMIIRFIYARPWQGAENSTQAVFRVTTTAK